MREQIALLEHHRTERDQAAVEAALTRLRGAASEEKADLMGPILAAVRSYATLGEICGAMREVFGDYRPPVSI
jgi:methylmalonyl-CoA mutase N-terminal domain/subunit